MPDKVGNKPPNEKVTQARSALTQFIELYQSDPVKRDPVIRTMLRGLTPSSAFEQTSVAVATLRNAGCLDSNKDSSDPVPAHRNAGKTEKGSGKQAEKKTPSPTPTKKVRGFAREVDVLLEDAVFREEFSEKSQHPVAAKLIELRDVPADVQYEVKRFQAEFEEVTYPNGKTGRKIVGFKEDPQGRKLFTTELVNVKDLNDMDLLATAAPKVYNQVIDEVNTKLFGWLNGATKPLPSEPDKTWPSLKGTKTLAELTTAGANRTKIITTLMSENFSTYGYATTLYYPDSGKFNKLVIAKPRPQRAAATKAK
jgi:hypothetical protein